MGCRQTTAPLLAQSGHCQNTDGTDGAVKAGAAAVSKTPSRIEMRAANIRNRRRQSSARAAAACQKAPGERMVLWIIR
jgi:hypothetical protein